MQKWTFFSMGVMAGLILLLGGALLAQGREPTAHAMMQGVDNQGKFALAVGGSAQGLNDMLWVLHEHPPMIKDRLETGEVKIQKGTRISLCLYKITRNGDQMRLCAVRDVAYDVEIPDYNSEDPKVRDVVQMIRKNMPKKED